MSVNLSVAKLLQAKKLHILCYSFQYWKVISLIISMQYIFTDKNNLL